MADYINVADKFLSLRTDRERTCRDFAQGKRKYLIFQTPDGDIWGDNRTPEICFKANIDYINKSLTVKSDHVPVLEPWFGTGVFAHIFGCPYVWRDDEAPAVHYRYHTMDEVCNIKKPDWEQSEIARLVMDTIRYFKAKTGDAIPIVWTDTQSASDTATMVLDASEVMAGCLEEPELIFEFMNKINDVTIKFSLDQAELIGNAIIKPGHIMLSSGSFSGMSISDDNLAVGSPDVNRRFNLPLNNEIGKAMGGVAIHSCGYWAHTMPFVNKLVPTCVAVDCGLDYTVDPNPNGPEQVRDAFAGTGIYTHVRLTGDTEKMLETVRRVLHPDLKIIVHPGYIDDATAEKNYMLLDALMSEYFEYQPE